MRSSHDEARADRGGRDIELVLTGRRYPQFALLLVAVGYGEIHPTDPAGGSICAAEAIVGQLYLAIMIARLVGLHASRVGSDLRPGAVE